MLQIIKGPEKFKQEDWQADDIEYLLSIPNSANWSSMGTFKTSTALWYLERIVPEQGNALIVTTKSGKGAYFTGIPRCLDESWRVFNVGTRNVEEIILGDIRLDFDLEEFVEILKQRKGKTIVLGHYHVFVRKSQMGQILVGGAETGKIKWDFVAADEAHKMKNKDTQWTRELKKLAHAREQKDSVVRHIMTGTGMVNNPAEAYSLFHFIDPDNFGSYNRFRRHFCEVERDYSTGFDVIVGPKNVEEFIELRKHYGPRRTMQEVHSSISEPIYTTLEVDLNPTQKRMYNETVKQLSMLDQQGFPIDSPNVVAQLQRLLQVSVATPELVDTYYDAKKDRRVQVVKLVEPSSKIDALMELVEGLQWDEEEKQQMIVFSWFRDSLELVKTRLDAKKIPYIHLEQKDSESTRFDKWHNQFPKKEHPLFLTTIALGGESINLSSAQYATFLDRPWSPALYSQAIGRIYRPGQTGAAEIININSRGTVDKKVIDNLNRKTSWFRQLFDDED